MKESRPHTLARCLREPLLHFVVLGTALFLLYSSVAPPPLTRRIVLSDAVIGVLRQDHLRRYGKPPTQAEEAALIQRFVDNEVLYREALALGLDRGDIIVRRRLVQKMEFLTEGMEPIPAPSDAELQAYLRAHSERYTVAARVSLTHVFVSIDAHGDDAERVARQLRDRLLVGTDPASLGDPFLRGRDFTRRTEQELAAAFGTTFAAQVMSLPVQTWSAPVRSSYGLHLVRITERSDGYLPRLDEVRPAVQRDWQEQRRATADREAMARLRRRYEIRVERAASGPSGLAQASELPPAGEGHEGTE